MEEGIILRLSKKIRVAGMFAVLNYFVDCLCDIRRRNPNAKCRIILDNYDIYQSRPGDDVFSYFFQILDDFPTSSATSSISVPVRVKAMVTRKGLKTKYGWDNARELFPPTEHGRFEVNKIIQTDFKLNSQTNQKVDDFVEKHFKNRYVIGVHLRGAGGIDGSAALKNHCEFEDQIPYSSYFEKIDERLKVRSDAKILICSDSQKVIDRVKQEYGSRVLCYESQRTDFGEFHLARHQGKELGQSPRFDPKLMGEEIIIEAWLLARCQYFIHGNSNISNFVVCIDPLMEHEDVFSSYYSCHLRWNQRWVAKIKSIYYTFASLYLRVMTRLFPGRKWL